MIDRVSDLRLSPEATVMLLKVMLAGKPYAFGEVSSMEYMGVEVTVGGGYFIGRYQDSAFRFVYEPDGGVGVMVAGNDHDLRYALWVSLSMFSDTGSVN